MCQIDRDIQLYSVPLWKIESFHPLACSLHLRRVVSVKRESSYIVPSWVLKMRLACLENHQHSSLGLFLQVLLQDPFSCIHFASPILDRLFLYLEAFKVCFQLKYFCITSSQFCLRFCTCQLSRTFIAYFSSCAFVKDCLEFSCCRCL